MRGSVVLAVQSYVCGNLPSLTRFAPGVPLTHRSQTQTRERQPSEANEARAGARGVFLYVEGAQPTHSFAAAG